MSVFLDLLRKHESLKNALVESERERFDYRCELESENRRLRGLLERGLERMKLINGPQEKCVINDMRPEPCANHTWIHEVEEALHPKGEK